MTYGIVTTVVGDVEVYDRLHEALLARTAAAVDGLLVHVCRRTGDGFQVIEVWESEEQLDRCNREVLWPLAAELGLPLTEDPPVVEAFEPRGLVLSGARLVR